MRSRGSRSSWIAWRVTENAPVIVACEAMIVAAVASSTMSGTRAGREQRDTAVRWAAAGSLRISAPCPK